MSGSKCSFCFTKVGNKYSLKEWITWGNDNEDGGEFQQCNVWTSHLLLLSLSLSYVTFDVVMGCVIYEYDWRGQWKNTWGREFVYTDSLSKLPCLIRQKIPCPFMSHWYPKIHMFCTFTHFSLILQAFPFFLFFFILFFSCFIRIKFATTLFIHRDVLLFVVELRKRREKFCFVFFM